MDETKRNWDQLRDEVEERERLARESQSREAKVLRKAQQRVRAEERSHAHKIKAQARSADRRVKAQERAEERKVKAQARFEERRRSEERKAFSRAKKELKRTCNRCQTTWYVPADQRVPGRADIVFTRMQTHQVGLIGRAKNAPRALKAQSMEQARNQMLAAKQAQRRCPGCGSESFVEQV